MIQFHRAVWLLALAFLGECFAADPLDQWQWRNPLPDGNILNAITYAAGQFVAVGDGGFVATSPDGVKWSEQAIGATSGCQPCGLMNSDRPQDESAEPGP